MLSILKSTFSALNWLILVFYNVDRSVKTCICAICSIITLCFLTNLVVAFLAQCPEIVVQCRTQNSFLHQLNLLFCA